MMPLAIVGVLIMSAIVGFGIWKLVNSFTLKPTTDRYRYVKAKDEHGNEITKVIDLKANDNEKNLKCKTTMVPRQTVPFLNLGQ